MNYNQNYLGFYISLHEEFFHIYEYIFEFIDSTLLSDVYEYQSNIENTQKIYDCSYYF